MKINLESIHFDADVKLSEFVERKINKLETFYDKIISAEVTLKLESNGQVQDKIAEIKLLIPGATLISKETTKIFEESVDLATDSLRRQLLKYKEKIREH
jgi:putative sigma-54 modulation protein